MKKNLLTLLLVLIFVSDSALLKPKTHQKDSSENASLEDPPSEVERLIHQHLYPTDKSLFLKRKFVDEVEKLSYYDGIEGVCMVFNGLIGVAATMAFLLMYAGVYEEMWGAFSDTMLPQSQEVFNLRSWRRLTTFIASFGAATILAASAYGALTKLVSWIPRYDYGLGSHAVLKDFLINWNRYKKCTPAEFHPFFDRLSERYALGLVTEEDLAVMAWRMVQYIRKTLDETSDPSPMEEVLVEETPA